MEQGEPYLRVRADAPEYLRDLQEESEFWDRPQLFSIEACENSPLDPRFDAHTNMRFTGDPRTKWFETIHRYGQFERGLCLGVSGLKQEARILEQNPSLHLTFCDISEDSLARRGEQLGARFPGRVSTRRVDLNFIQLPADAYDLIISSGAMHHLINIEHLAEQINRSLTSGGYFFLQDYVAEDRFQFEDRKKAFYEAFLSRARARGQLLKSSRAVWPQLHPWQHSAFEAIRSQDTLDILRDRLTQVDLHTTGALVGLLLFTQTDSAPTVGDPGSPRKLWRRIARRVQGINGGLLAGGSDASFLADLFLLDELVCDSGILRPFNAFGVYRTRPDEQSS